MSALARCIAVLTLCAGFTAAAAVPVQAAPAVETVAPGVTYQEFGFPTSHGRTRIHLVTVDLRRAGVHAGLLWPGAVAERAPVARMAQAPGVVAALNGDFFDISEDRHPGVPATDAPVGPVVLDGEPLKAAVPGAQRFGWAPGDTEEVFGVGTDGRARTGHLRLHGRIGTTFGDWPLGGLNQYALPQDSIGVFTPAWGRVSRARAVCGSDQRRAAPCALNTHRVTIGGGRVLAGADDVGGNGPITPGTVELIGRGGGADRLRTLTVGAPVDLDWQLASSTGVPFDFALGAHQLLSNHHPVAGLDNSDREPRSAVGISQDGHVLRLVATDGREGTDTGLSPHELAKLLKSLHCTDGVYLDGGGSTTLATRAPDSPFTVVRNSLDGAVQRPVPNGIAIRFDQCSDCSRDHG